MAPRYADLVPAFAMLVVLSAAERALGDPGTALGIHPTRLVVKYRASLDACVDCLLARGIPLASVTKSDSLDRLHRELGITRARALFASRPALLGPQASALTGGRSAAHRQLLDDVRRRFPARAARAPRNAVMPDLSAIYVLELPPGADVVSAAERYRDDPLVEWAEPDRERGATLLPNDPYLASSGTWGQSYADLWGLHLTEAPTAWDTSTGAGVLVAVIDTGVDASHPDLAANMWTNPLEVPANDVDDDGNGFVDDVRGWDFSDHDATPDDLHGHGTHVAGTVAAVGNNARGVVGMAWGAKVMAVRGLNAYGGGYDTDLAAAVVYAAENGADVLNASWGGRGDSPVLNDAVDAITALGAILIAAAGNAASDMSDFFPASIPDVVAVGATTASDSVAYFSNYGDGLAVGAPGLDILSLRAGGIPLLGNGPVGTDYARLSGTSMAAPHVAGLTAVLIAGLPGLSLAEIRSHLELNADQPGYPGYEGQIWNPYYGFGRINAARVFDPPPLLSFFRTGAVELHALTDTALPDAARARWDFTSEAPIAWTLTVPPFLSVPPGSESGNGPGEALLSADTTGMVPGRYTGDVVLDAPATGNGGVTVPATLQVHEDARLGGPITVDLGFGVQSWMDLPPRLASDGVGTVMVWGGFDAHALTNQILSSRIDGAGVATAPTVLAHSEVSLLGPSNYTGLHALGFDGRNFLLVYVDGELPPGDNVQTVYVKALRLGPDGHPIEGGPIILSARKRTNPYNPYAVDVGFDGDAYTVLWSQEAKPPGHDLSTGERVVFYVQRVGIDGTARGKPRRIYSRVNPIEGIDNYSPGRIACTNGSCVAAWRHIELSAYTANPRYLEAMQVIGDRAVQKVPVRVMSDVHNFRGLATNGTDYLALGDRLAPGVSCAWAFDQPNLVCPHDIVVARIGATATALDPAGIVVNNKANTTLRPMFPGGVTFDGSDYVATFLAEAKVFPPYCNALFCLSQIGYQVFAARIGADGSVLTDEIPGSMLHPERTAIIDSGRVAATRTHSVIGLIRDDDGTPPLSIYAQRVLPRTPAVALPDHEIGSIGAQAVDERAALAFTVRPPAGFDPDDTVISASNLPPGAVFDVATRTFRWMPDANEVGVYPALHFEAVDGPSNASEDVTITVAEANLSLGGVLTVFGGAPVTGVTVELKGMGRPRLAVTDTAGRYQFDDVVAGEGLRLKLGKKTGRDYFAYPSVRGVVMGTSDLGGQDFELTPH
jgi:hypothetical protein